MPSDILRSADEKAESGRSIGVIKRVVDHFE